MDNLKFSRTDFNAGYSRTISGPLTIRSISTDIIGGAFFQIRQCLPECAFSGTTGNHIVGNGWCTGGTPT